MDDGLGIGALPLLTTEQEQTLLQQVRVGDEDARHRLVLAVLRKVLPSTRARLANGGVGMWRVELADVMQQAYLALLELLPRVIALEYVMARLVVEAQHCIAAYVQQQRCLVQVPTKARFPLPPVDSLDAPVVGREGEEEDTLADRLAAPAQQAPVVGDGSALYEELRRLPLHYRQALVACYGLDGEALDVASPTVERPGGKTHGRAVRQLRQQLASLYPQYAGEYRKASVRPACADVIVTQVQRERLTLAYQALCVAQGKVTTRALAKAARVSRPAVIAYLYERRGGSAA